MQRRKQGTRRKGQIERSKGEKARSKEKKNGEPGERSNKQGIWIEQGLKGWKKKSNMPKTRI